METTIIMLLVLALAILLAYVVINGKRPADAIGENRHQSSELPDIIGQPKSGTRQTMQSVDVEWMIDAKSHKPDAFEPVTGDTPSQFPQEDSDEIAYALPDWEEEEEEMERSAAFNTEDGLATGVTFDELVNAAKFLQQQALEASEKENATEVFSKIDGTELLDLLESRIGDASKKIALLLDRSISGHLGSGSSGRNEK